MPAPTAPARRLPLRRRLLFALVPLCGLLFVAEVITRLVRAPLYFDSFRLFRTSLLHRNYPATLDPQLGYVPRANFASRDNHWRTQVSIDADGMRSNGAPPPPGERVIAAVGDSFTFGDQVDDDASWPALLERELGVPVKNGGVFGYSLAQAVLRAEQMLARFRVDALVVSFIPDDLTRSTYRRRYTGLPWFAFTGDGLELRGVPIDPNDGSADPAKAWKDRLGHSALLDAVLANVATDWWVNGEKQVPVPELVGQELELGKRLIDRIATRCRNDGVRLLVILQDRKSTPVAVAVLQHAASLGLPTIDFAARFAERNAADPTLEKRWFAGHMTREGNAWVAHEIAAVLRR